MTAETHTDWATPAWERAPVAAAVGPFAGRAMLQAWWEAYGDGELLLLEGADALIPMNRVDDTIQLLGDPDLFDYHSPLGPGAAKLIAEWAAALPTGTRLDFDSMPAEAADLLLDGLRSTGLSPAATIHQSTAVLELPPDFDSYLTLLGKKQRHETRRKARRFTELLGAPRLQRVAGFDAVATFAAMHRLSSGDKGDFMNPATEALFGALHEAACGVIDFLYGDDDEPVAAAFGFEDATTYYLYNSAYLPDAGTASPGIVLVAELIRRAIDAGLRRFDFLKGDEVYKYRLGATARPLWRIRAAVEEQS